MKKHTRDYYSILLVTPDGEIKKSAHTETHARKILEALRDKYGDQPGRLSLQTWKYNDFEGPTAMESEKALETWGGWEPPKPEPKPKGFTPLVRTRLHAEWPAAKR